MRRRNCKNATTRLSQYSQTMVFEPTQHRGRWHVLFDNNNPIHLEIGMGKGKFITTLASENPHINYIGMEKYDSVILQAAKKAEVMNLPNLKLISTDALKIAELFNEAEISKIYLNFSDPWPKAAHAKRRLTSPNFLKLYRFVLTKEGTIAQKTDNLALFEYSMMTFADENYITTDLNFDLHATEKAIVTTEYEDRFSAFGQTIYFIEVKNE